MKKWTERKINEAIRYRASKQVTSYYSYEDGTYGTMVFELCPTCNNAIERTYQNYCSECGQKLKWSKIEAMMRAQEEIEIDMMIKAMENEGYRFRKENERTDRGSLQCNISSDKKSSALKVAENIGKK